MESQKFDLQNFVLNSGLSEECLLAVLNHFTAIDLLEMYDINDETDHEFVKFMKKRVMNTKLFDLTEIVRKQNKWTIRRIFETFGKSMKKLKVCNRR